MYPTDLSESQWGFIKKTLQLEERKRKQQQKQTLQWRVEKECFDSTKGYPGEGPDTNKDK